MNKNLLFSLAIGLCLSTSVNAQQKRLTQAQALGGQLSLTKSMNGVMGWADATHYIEMDSKERKQYAVDINTGARTPYTPPPKSDVNVSVRDKDVYIQYGKETPKRLTNNADEELNPTLSPDGKICSFYS